MPIQALVNSLYRHIILKPCQFNYLNAKDVKNGETYKINHGELLINCISNKVFTCKLQELLAGKLYGVFPIYLYIKTTKNS